MSEPAWLKAARADVGLRELPGAPTEPRIAAWLKKLSAWLSSSFRLRDGSFRRHAASLNALPNEAARNSELCLGLREVELLSENLKLECVPFVVVLLSALNPSAVVRLVVAVIVAPIKLVAGAWSRAHVGKEVIERQPPAANFDTATAVSIVAAPTRLKTPPLHIGPNPLSWRVRHAVSPYFRTQNPSPRFSSAVAAHDRFSLAQVIWQRLGFGAAVTSHKAMPAIPANDRPFPVPFTIKVFHGV